MELFYGVSQLFFKLGPDSVVQFLLSNVTDILLFSDADGTIERFIELIGDWFDVCKVIYSGHMNFNGFIIRQNEDCSITM